MKSLLTVKWVTKFVTSLVALNPELKKGIKLKESGDWNAYKPFVDAALYKWLNPLMDMAGDSAALKHAELSVFRACALGEYYHTSAVFDKLDSLLE